MIPLSPHLPSTSDIVTISRIPSTTTSDPNPPSLPSLLSPLVNLLRNPDVRSYLLSPHPHHVSTLLSPTLSTTSHLFSYVATRASPLLPAPLTSFISHFDMQFLYAPTLSLSQVLLGAGIMNIRSFHCPLSLPTISNILFEDLAPDFGLFRFAIDPAQNLCLMLYSIPSSDAFLVFYSQMPNTRSSTSACLIFSHSQLLPLLMSDHNSLQPHLLAKAVLYYAFEQGRNPCRICNRTDQQGPCSCTYLYEKAMHPQDTFPFISLVTPHTGKFEFTCHEASLHHGRVVTMDVLGVRERFEGFVDADIKTRMLDGALRKYFKGMHITPQKALPFTQHSPLLQHSDATLPHSTTSPDDNADALIETLLPLPTTPVPHAHHVSVMPADNAAALNSVTACHTPPVQPEEAGCGELQALKQGANQAQVVRLAAPLAPQESRAHVWARRRERNRLSAQRSNLKRKMKVEALEAQLKSGRERIGRLRERELALRKENLELRGWCK